MVVASKRLRLRDESRQVLFLTNHRPLTWLLENFELLCMQTRQRIALFEFDINVECVEEKHNELADVMYRETTLINPLEM